MRRIILTAAALTLAGPALAASQIDTHKDLRDGGSRDSVFERLNLGRSEDNKTAVSPKPKGVLVISIDGASGAHKRVRPAALRFSGKGEN